MKIFETIQNHMFSNLLNLCKRELGISKIPKIVLIDDNSVGGGNSFGIFIDDEIHIAIKGRHPMDISRTLAHELVHWKQRTENQELDGSDGSTTENDANAIAGQIMRKFGRIYPEYFINSLP